MLLKIPKLNPEIFFFGLPTVKLSGHEVDYEKRTTSSLKNNPCTSGKCNDSEDEKLQLKTIHQTNPSVMEQPMKNSSFDPTFFKHISQFNYFVLLLLLHWMKIQY